MSTGARIDDLIDELYPTAKRAETTTASPNPTTVPAKRAEAEGAAGPSSRAAPQNGGHTFDDDDDTTDQSACLGPSATSSAGPGRAPIAAPRAAVPWPSLPPALGPCVHCTEGTVTLTSYVTAEASREVHRLTNLTSAQLRSVTNCRPSRHGADDDGGRWCPYVRCRHCDHVVVRLQGAYWVVPAAASQTTSPPLAANVEDKGEVPKKHSFDDSDDDESSPRGAKQPSSSPPASASDMYMMMRYHYPDFGAFPTTVLRRIADPAGQSAAAAYCCQCTWVSVLEPRLTLPCGGHGAPPALVPPQTSAAGVYPPPSSADSVQWACKGHIAGA